MRRWASPTLQRAVENAPRSSPAFAQVLYGSIVGSVADQAGASVTGARVRIPSTGTNQTCETDTDQSETHTFALTPGDTYEVAVTKPGFQTFTVRYPGRGGLTDAILKVGAIEQPVEVSAQALTLQTESGEVRSEITTRSLENLPIPVGRNYQNLPAAVPGVSPPANQH